MKKNIFVFGIISGVIVSAMLLFSVSLCYADGSFEPNAVLGYASMVIAFSLIFVGVRNYRDKFNGGTITFGRALLTGIYITLVASAMYIIVWLIDYYLFVPDFIEKYGEVVFRQTQKAGGDTEAAMKQIDWFKEIYKNPLGIIVLTFMEIFPVGLVISLIAALILKRKAPAITTNNTA